MQKFPLKMATKDLLITELYRDRDQHQLDYFESLASTVRATPHGSLLLLLYSTLLYCVL